MTTPGSNENLPQGGAPQGQPSWGTPPPGYGQGAGQGYGPAPTYSGSPAGYGETAQRPGTVTGAAITGIVWGGISVLFGVLGLLGASVVDDLGIEISAFDVIVLILGVAAAIALLIGGIQVLQGKAPKLLLYAAYAGLGLWLLGVISSIVQGHGFSAFSLVDLILLGAIVALLMQPQSKQYFASRGQSV